MNETQINRDFKNKLKIEAGIALNRKEELIAEKAINFTIGFLSEERRDLLDKIDEAQKALFQAGITFAKDLTEAENEIERLKKEVLFFINENVKAERIIAALGNKSGSEARALIWELERRSQKY